MASEYNNHAFRKHASQDQSSQEIDTQKSTSKIGSHINELYNKFMTLNKQVSLQFDLSAFNMAEFQKQDSKLQYDQQMVQAKLKRLENNFQLKKANFELQNRKKRSPKKKSSNAINQEDSYLNIYKNYATNISKKLFKGENQSDSDQQGKRNEEPIKGISFSKELRKHPRFLQFTIDKMKQKQLMEIQQKHEKTETLQKLKKQIKQLVNRRSLSKKKVDSEINPEQLADNIFRKIYTKKNKEPPIQEAKTDKRVAKIIDKQESILDTIDERSLSKQNYKKLKGRMNGIANELYLDDKKHMSKIFLPKLRLNNISTIQYVQRQ